MAKKFSIANRRGLKVVIQVDENNNSTKLVFIAHGQKGFKEQTHIQAFADSFLADGFRVVRFDATHSLGESEGEVIDVTFDSYIDDLKDVISWARHQDWFVEPFALCGHSMGGQSTAWYAEHHPKEVSLLVTMAPVVNYELYCSTMDQVHLDSYRERGYKEEQSRSKPGTVTRIGWGVMESLKKFDILPMASRLTMPVLDIVGEFDRPCPMKHQEEFLNLVASKHKQLVAIKGADHNYRNAQTNEYGQELIEVKDKLSAWIMENSL